MIMFNLKRIYRIKLLTVVINVERGIRPKGQFLEGIRRVLRKTRIIRRSQERQALKKTLALIVRSEREYPRFKGINTIQQGTSESVSKIDRSFLFLFCIRARSLPEKFAFRVVVVDRSDVESNEAAKPMRTCE